MVSGVKRATWNLRGRPGTWLPTTSTPNAISPVLSGHARAPDQNVFYIMYTKESYKCMEPKPYQSMNLHITLDLSPLGPWYLGGVFGVQARSAMRFQCVRRLTQMPMTECSNAGWARHSSTRSSMEDSEYRYGRSLVILIASDKSLYRPILVDASGTAYPISLATPHP